MNRHNTLTFTLISLIVLLNGCATPPTISSDAQTNEKPALVQKTLDIKVAKTKAKKSGLGVPQYKNGQLVGYQFQRSFAIPAQIGNFFGFSYVTNQVLAINNADKAATGEIVKKVPVIVTVTHPEIITNGQASTQSAWQDTLYFGRDNFAMWNFESNNELVSGKWTIEVKHQDTVVATKNFFVQVPPPMPAKVTTVCQVESEKFPKALQKSNQKCCAENDAQACYNFAWRGLERIKDKHGAALYYAKSCELGDISGCRLAAKLASNEQTRNDFYHKGCDLKDMDSCIEVNRLPQ
ncbi:hypothetical protein PCIT_b0452 [Pseudoalteromonas citrea]|uniref:DUF3859 domain-containing protein n=2 Tax=Pseudoalteromonas citrea TaxID=43655 RepID=A0AAD4FPX7_9GAMM|nr:DUF3859 domain-containing protein [Pseudoalteromonas citrea]KAF7764448.1 hypothetical protein PCIT_b0452 [Pseudoalteromonas citrea]